VQASKQANVGNFVQFACTRRAIKLSFELDVYFFFIANKTKHK